MEVNEKDKNEKGDCETEGSEVSSDGKFECLVCGKLYAQEAGLSRHMLTHDDAKIKTCTTCHKYKTNRADSMKRHMKTCQVQDQDLKCRTCDTTFQFPSYLKRHVCSKSKTGGKKTMKVRLPPKGQKKARSANSGACAYLSTPPASPSESVLPVPPVPSNLSTLIHDAALIWNASQLLQSEYMHRGAVDGLHDEKVRSRLYLDSVKLIDIF